MAADRDEIAPLPDLTYSVRRDGEGVRGTDGPPLARVDQVRAWKQSDGSICVYARGRMRCKDGHVGPSRALRVDVVRRGQPAWLEIIVEDAHRRLAEVPEPPCWHGPACSGTGPDCAADEAFCWPRRGIHAYPHTCALAKVSGSTEGASDGR